MTTPLQITSTKNPRVKAVLRLQDRKGRMQQGRFLINGARELERAILAGVELVEVYARQSPEWERVSRLVTSVQRTGAEIIRVSDAVFRKMAYGERSAEVLGVAKTPRPTIDRLPAAGNRLFAVLEQVEKPGNVGAVLRSADAAGVSGLILADPRTDLFNPNAVRASMGTIFSVPTAELSAEQTLAWLRGQAIRIFAARVDGSVPYTQVDFTGPSALVLGSEAEGLSATWHGDDITAIRLPMRGIADSLNVSVTAAVLFYEALRQRETRVSSPAVFDG